LAADHAQATQLLHRGREQSVRQRTMLVNPLRAHLAEFGLVAAQGLRNVGEPIAIVRDRDDRRVPNMAREILQVLANQIEQIETAIAALERQLLAWHKTNAVSQRRPAFRVSDALSRLQLPRRLRTRRCSARAESSPPGWAWCRGRIQPGGKTRLGGITKRGNRYLRRLLINGASAKLLRSKATKADPWVIELRRRRPPLVVAVALANKTARIAWAAVALANKTAGIAWAVMLHDRQYQPRVPAA
jgi:transposase